jgi:hypothetical protein
LEIPIAGCADPPALEVVVHRFLQNLEEVEVDVIVESANEMQKADLFIHFALWTAALLQGSAPFFEFGSD